MRDTSDPRLVAFLFGVGVGILIGWFLCGRG